MIVIRELKDSDGKFYRWAFWCEGCKCPHAVDNSWDFDQNFSKPSFHPSILVYSHTQLDNTGKKEQTPQCHSFVKNGKISYLGDCTHQFAGKTLDLISIEEW